MVEQINRVIDLLGRLEFKLFDKRFVIKAELDKKYENRIYIQVSYKDNCRNTGKPEIWKGRKWYLSDHMTDDEVVKTAFAACQAVVNHEVMEGFTVDNMVLFNPHVSYEALLSITKEEVRRNEKITN